MSSGRNRFQLNDAEINRILFCDDSDTEDVLVLEDENIDFIVEMEANSNTEDIDVIMDPPNDTMVSVDEGDAPSNFHNTHSSEVPTRFIWRTGTAENAPSFICETDTSFEFGKVLINTSDDQSPYELFEKAARFDKFINEIVIPQTILYSQQRGHVFSTDIYKIKTYFGLNLVVGYHVLPSVRDYWSSDPDLSVPFISNGMPRKRFEEKRSLLHFNSNESMRAPSDPLHDRTFKVRVVLDHFNESFSSVMSPSQFQSKDEHMIKIKELNITRKCEG